LADPRHPDRSDAPTAAADLLWFPTGGGKTEAYLGVAAFTLAIRRLQGELGGLSGAAGVAVLMRYTLRLLTLQQFQRAATLICACEMIRREDPAVWGHEPFRIGLWVGQRSTPNWTKDAAEAIKQDRDTGFSGAAARLTNSRTVPGAGGPSSPAAISGSRPMSRAAAARSSTAATRSAHALSAAASHRAKGSPSWW
jgi:hypothetical protein